MDINLKQKSDKNNKYIGKEGDLALYINLPRIFSNIVIVTGLQNYSKSYKEWEWGCKLEFFEENDDREAYIYVPYIEKIKKLDKDVEYKFKSYALIEVNQKDLNEIKINSYLMENVIMYKEEKAFFEVMGTPVGVACDKKIPITFTLNPVDFL